MYLKTHWATSRYTAMISSILPTGVPWSAKVIIKKRRTKKRAPIATNFLVLIKCSSQEPPSTFIGINWFPALSSWRLAVLAMFYPPFSLDFCLHKWVYWSTSLISVYSTSRFVWLALLRWNWLFRIWLRLIGARLGLSTCTSA